MINYDEQFEIGHDCSCPVITLYSARKHTTLLDCDRSEIDLHLYSNFRSFGHQEKVEDKKRDLVMIGTLDFDHDHRFRCFVLFMISFAEVFIRSFDVLGTKLKPTTLILGHAILGGHSNFTHMLKHST